MKFLVLNNLSFEITFFYFKRGKFVCDTSFQNIYRVSETAKIEKSVVHKLYLERNIFTSRNA